MATINPQKTPTEDFIQHLLELWETKAPGKAKATKQKVLKSFSQWQKELKVKNKRVSDLLASGQAVELDELVKALAELEDWHKNAQTETNQLGKEVQICLKEQAEIKREISVAADKFQKELLAKTKATKAKKSGKKG